MKYIGTENFDHEQPTKLGVLLTNLGTPQAPEKKALRTYLREFLSDPRVVEIPRLLWWLILHGIILNLRPARSAEAYSGVWTEEGSPLMVHTRAQAQALQQRFGAETRVEFAMRYGEPAIHRVVQEMLNDGVRKLLVLPLYPQYSGPTTGSTFDALAKDFTQRRWLPDFRFVSHYHDHPAYIKALAASIREHQQQNGIPDKLLFSYHGEPRSFLDKGDPYHCECLKTTRLVAEELGLDEDAYTSGFQSRFGKAEWLRPYTDEILKGFPGEGVKSIQVICPGFSADCLETLEEIAIENRDYFMEAGGIDFQYIPCLNSSPTHIDALEGIVRQHLQGWE